MNTNFENDFNFDDPIYIKSNKIESAKVINKFLGGKKGLGGIWISTENLESINWRKEENGSFKNTIKHDLKSSSSGDEVIVEGFGIKDPRICVIRRTGLLRMCQNIYSGVWTKGDGEIKNEHGDKKYQCVRRYLILFLDEKNKPLHFKPVQLTAKGTFQIDFGNTLQKFYNEMRDAYAVEKKQPRGNMDQRWNAMCVFVPNFRTKSVGKGTKTSEACYVESYIVPTVHNWKNICVGYDNEVKNIIISLYNDNESWQLKYLKDNVRSTENNICSDFTSLTIT